MTMMIPFPDDFAELPYFLKAFLGSTGRLSKKTRAVLRELADRLLLLAIDDDLPLPLRRACEAIGLWLDRVRMGEAQWAEFMQDIAEDVRRFGNTQEVLAAPAELISA